MDLPNLSALCFHKMSNIATPSQHPRQEVDPEEPSMLVYVFRKLGIDALQAILNAIGESDKSKESACNSAIHALCDTNKEIREMCDSDPKFWINMGKRIFENAPENPFFHTVEDRAVRVVSLIYNTFRDDESPRVAFTNMCYASGLADALQSRFYYFALPDYRAELIEQWTDHNGHDYDEITEYESATAHVPELEYIDDWIVDSKSRFEQEPSKDEYIIKYKQDDVFREVANLLYGSTNSYLFSTFSKAIRSGSGVHRLDILFKVLGIYTVCLWKNKRDFATPEQLSDQAEKEKREDTLVSWLNDDINLILGDDVAKTTFLDILMLKRALHKQGGHGKLRDFDPLQAPSYRPLPEDGGEIAPSEPPYRPLPEDGGEIAPSEPPYRLSDSIVEL